jgi:hypothetical protein
MPDDERDRVDMVVEKMMPEDADLLARIANEQRPFGRIPSVFALRGIGELRIATSSSNEFADEALSEARFLADPVTLASLASLTCLDLAQSEATIMRGGFAGGVPFAIHRLTITSLGDLVLQALDDVRAGYTGSPTH